MSTVSSVETSVGLGRKSRDGNVSAVETSDDVKGIRGIKTSHCHQAVFPSPDVIYRSRVPKKIRNLGYTKMESESLF